MHPKEQLMKELTAELNQLCSMYHTLGVSLVPDSVYDAKYLQLQQLEEYYPHWVQPNSPTRKVGAPVQESSKTITMTVPMLSIKTHTDCESSTATAFDTYIKEQLRSSDPIEYCCELKYDGLSINLRYRHGHFVSANLRGDGSVGEDVTVNASALTSFPKVLLWENPAESVEIRAECIFLKQDFDALNKRQQERIDKGIKGIKPYANARNAVAGLIRRSGDSLLSSANLQIFAYGLGECSGYTPPAKQSELLDTLASWGFRPTNRQVVSDPAMLSKWHELVNNKRDDLEFEIDGVVYKVNDRSIQDTLGFNAREPKWAIAHKFAPQEKLTRLKEIDLQVGRTGRITPVGKIDPVAVGGVVVSSVNLHNEDEIRRTNIAIGDTVVVRRAGDVIPEIIASVHEGSTDRREYSIYHSLNGICPSCQSPITKVGADWRCTAGMACSAQRVEMLVHFCSRRMMDIQGIGDKIAELLVNKDLVRRTSDVYHLTHDSLVSVGISPLVATSILKSIEKSKSTAYENFLYALGIPSVGEETAQLLATHYPVLEDLIHCQQSDLLRIPGIGPSTAELVCEYFSHADNVSNITRCIDAGVHWTAATQAQSSLSGKTFVITGTLPTMSRDVFVKTVKQHGGKVSGTVSNKVDYVVVGENAGDKFNRAQVLNIPILSEEEFLSLLH